MRELGVFEAKQQLSALIAAAESGEDVRITRHGRVVARLVAVRDADPASTDAAAKDARAQHALERMQQARAQVRPGPGWRELIDEGRRF